MAKVQFGQGVANMQGSIGGTTMTRTKGGPAARNKVKPNNPATPAQMAQRERITRLSKSWQGLTEEQRKAWDEDAKNTKRVGVCGNNITLTGHQLYVRVNSAREENGDGVDPGQTPAPSEFIANVFGDTANCEFNIGSSFFHVPLGAAAVDGLQVTIWCTAARSAGKMAYKGVLKKTYTAAITSDDVTATYINIMTEWISKFGAIAGTTGKAVTLSCREYSDGSYSNPLIMKAICAA